MQLLSFIKSPFVLIFMCIFLVSACTDKTDTNTENTPAKKNAETMQDTSKSDAKPALGQSYTATYAKAKETVTQALAANPKNFREGQQYTVLTSGQGVLGSGDKIEVVEFFSYGCPACFNAEPSMHAYSELVKDDVEFIRVPVSFNPQYETLARGYYAANALGVSEDAHIALFDALHVKRQNLYSTTALANFYAHYGVDKSAFKKTVKSFSVNSLIQRDKKFAQSYQVSGVPTVVVNGKYNTGGRKAGNMVAWVQILDFLTEKERTARVWTKKTTEE